MNAQSKIFSFECFGVKISVASNRRAIPYKIKKEMPFILPVKWTEISDAEAEHRFYFNRNHKNGEISAFKDEELIIAGSDLETSMQLLISRIRLTIAEFAIGFAFLHAGVVGWQNRAIIIPGKSFAGKTTLVAEFAKNGCVYFSDEYALIDQSGLVHPFPKKLSMRGIIDDYKQVERAVEDYGGKIADEPFPIGYVLITEYKKNTRSKSKNKLGEVSLGEGIMKSLANSISVRQNPRFVLEILNEALRETVVVKAERGEASEFVKKFFGFLKDRDGQSR